MYFSTAAFTRSSSRTFPTDISPKMMPISLSSDSSDGSDKAPHVSSNNRARMMALLAKTSWFGPR